MIYGNCVGGIGLERTYILEDDNGNEVVAVMSKNEVMFDATANDIRAGKVAASATGIVTGEKEIPSYQTVQGRRVIKPGQALDITLYSEQCQYTGLIAIICEYANDVTNSVSAVMTVMNDKLYAVKSTTALAEVTVDNEAESIKLGIANESNASLLIRYMTYKEEL